MTARKPKTVPKTAPNKTEQRIDELAKMVERLADLVTRPPDAIEPETGPQRVDVGQLSTSYVVRWIMALFVGYVAITGYQHYRVSIKKAEPVEVAPVVDQEVTWKQLSTWVSNGRIETTGELLGVAKQLELDLARLKPLIDKPARITEENRQSVLDLIGGAK